MVWGYFQRYQKLEDSFVSLAVSSYQLWLYIIQVTIFKIITSRDFSIALNQVGEELDQLSGFKPFPTFILSTFPFASCSLCDLSAGEEAK